MGEVDGKAINDKGSLTNLCIHALQSQYGHVLKSNKGSTKTIAKGVMAILYYYLSPEEDPQHQYCSKGEI